MATLDDPVPLPDDQPVVAEPEEPVCTCTTRCTEGNVNQTCEACMNDVTKCHVSETQPVVDTYEFYVDGKCLDDWTQNLQEGETLSVPGNPTKDGAVFQRWYKLDDAQNRITVESGAVSGVSGKTVRVDAEFAEFSYVLFMSADGTAVVHTAQGSSGNAVSNADLKAAAEMVNLSLGPTEAVVGWSSTQGGEASAVAFAAGTVKVYPVIMTGYWVIFDSKGGDYVAPIFAQNGQTVTLPTTATRSGYTFDGWYQGEQRVERVSAEATLEAHWIAAANTKYTVIHWQENANDDGYSFKESETKTGKTGEQTAATAKNYSKEGFTVQAIKQQTIAGDGSTIVNVYYKRNVYTITFHVYTCGKAEHTHGLGCILGCGQQAHKHTNACRGKDIIIKAKHGANISEKWPTVNGSCTWSVNEKFTDGPWQTNIDTMPIGGANFYGPLIASSTVYAYYYVEALPGTSGQAYILHHTDSSAHDGGRLVVTDEDKYPITGFTYKSGPQNGESYINAKFYYTRNSYSIVFINNGIKQKTEYLKYEQSLNGVGYTPERPANVPAGYEFAGWYDNEAGEGNAFVFDGKTMPAQNITLYAKWKAPEISATVCLTVEIDGVKETLSVPYGSSLKDAPGYEALMQKVRENNDGKEPSAWFSVDSDGGKKLFNPDTKLYGNVTLVPHFSGTVDTFKVTYVEENDQPGPVDGNDYQSGSYATVLGPINGNLRFLYWKDEAHNKIYKPGESVKMSGDVTLTAHYTEAPARVALVYHDGEKTNAENGIRSNDFTKVKSAADVGFTAPNGYTFAGWSTTQGGKAEYFAGNTFFVPKDGADLYAVWTKRTDLSLTVLYQEEGTGENLENPVIYYGKTFEEKIPVAQYKKDITGYTWVSTTPEDTLTIGVGSNVITLYYKRNTHQVSYRYTGTVPTGAPNVPAASEEAYETTVTVAPAPTLDGYVFSGWTAAGIEVDENGFFTMPNQSVEFTGSWSARSDLSYIVEYREGSETGTELKDAKTENGKTFGETYTENAEVIDGYTVDADTKTVTVTTGENKIIFIYTKRADLGYTVEYREGSETGTELKDAKTETGKTFGETYTENAEVIDGYTVDADTKTVTVTTGENKIIFIYTKRADLGYTVEYREGSETGTELRTAKTENGKTYGVTYTENAAAIEGYTVDADTKTVTVTTGENKIIFIYTKRTDLSYTVEYREGSETGTELRTAKTENGKTYGVTYTENAAAIEGYTVDADTKTVTVTTGENKIIFIYTKRTDLTYTVKYLWTDGMGSGTAIEGVQDKVVENVTFGQEILEDPIEIPGYTPVETGKVERRMDKESLTIVFPYYKNVTLTAASDSVVYNGTTQTLSGYTSSEAEAEFEGITASGSGKDVGEYAVTFSGVSEREQKISKNGRYLLTGTVDGKITITPREAVITVNNGTKTAGRNDPAFTGTVTGLIGENDLGVVSYVRTNNAEAVGTYADVLTALYTENANYDVRVINGTFVITAANNPNPNPPQPNPNPPQPNPNPPQPQPEPEPEVEPEAGPEVTPEEPQPAAPDAGPVEEIADGETPLAMGGAWALVNLILTVLTVLGSILLLIGYIGKKQKEREDENGNVILNAEGEAETDDIKKKGGWRLASIIPAVAAVIAFILTENMRLPMVLVDKWTLLMVIIALVQLLVAYFSKKKTQEPEQPEQMVANA